jgi:hypothetical protein
MGWPTGSRAGGYLGLAVNWGHGKVEITATLVQLQPTLQKIN